MKLTIIAKIRVLAHVPPAHAQRVFASVCGAGEGGMDVRLRWQGDVGGLCACISRTVNDRPQMSYCELA